MRKILIIIALFSSFGLHAQAQANADSSAHLTFKGVPIDGTLNSFVLKMKQNGFTQVTIQSGIAMLKGDFATYRNCSVIVITPKPKDLVSKVAVIFPECDTWSSLSSNYFSLKLSKVKIKE